MAAHTRQVGEIERQTHMLASMNVHKAAYVYEIDHCTAFGPCSARGKAAYVLGVCRSNRLQITKWPHKGGARNGAKLGSMCIIHHARLINIIIIVRRKRINLITNQT